MLELIFLKVINMSWGAGIVILIVCLARFLLKKFPKYISYMLWSVVLFRLFCPMILEIDISPVRNIEPILYEYTVEEEIVLPEIIVEYNEPHMAPETVTDSEDGQIVYESVILEENSKEEKLSWQEWAVLVGKYMWILGMSVMFLRFAVSVIQMRKKVSTAIPVKDNIYITDETLSPFVMGILKPRIYLSTELSEKEQEYIILHEQFHIKRCDHIIKMIAYVALCIHWFNPLVWLSYVLFCKDMEMSCDEAVIKKMGEGIRADYSASLLALATRHQIIGIPVDFGEGDTKGRIKNLARFRKIKPAVIVVLVIGVVILMVFLAFNHKSSNSDVNGLNDEGSTVSNEEESNQINEEETESLEDEEIVEIDTMEEINEYKIPEQTFDVYLDDWGEVTFVSCKIPRSIFTDASFFLVKDEQILYQFPHRFKDNTFEYTGAIWGEGVGAVGFRDVNFDKEDDIIIISYYESGAGPTGSVPRPYVTIYLAGENEFYLAEDMIEEVEYNISGKDISIESVYNYLIDRELGYNMTWEKAYKNIIHNIEDNLVDPYSLRNDLDLYVYIGVHDFDNDSIPEIIIGDGISVAVFTYMEGQVHKIADLYEPKNWGSINGLHYKDNSIILESNGSDGSCYVCFTYNNGNFIIGRYDEYNADKPVINEIVVTEEEFEKVFNLAELSDDSRVSYITKKGAMEEFLEIDGKNISVRDLDFNLVMW